MYASDSPTENRGARTEMMACTTFVNAAVNGTTVSTCDCTIYDSGGETGDYSSGEDVTFQICSDDPTKSVKIDFTAFSTETGYDILSIYDGNSITAFQIGSWSGTTSPGTIVSSGQCLTLVWHSDGSVVRPGFKATVSCVSTATVGNFVWQDYNANGLQSSETGAGINSVLVRLYKDDGSGTFVLVDSIYTNYFQSGSGYYQFTVEQSGTYKVKFPLPGFEIGGTLTTQTAGSGIDGNSDADPVTGFSPAFQLDINGTGILKSNQTIDAGYHSTCTNENYVVPVNVSAANNGTIQTNVGGKLLPSTSTAYGDNENYTVTLQAPQTNGRVNLFVFTLNILAGDVLRVYDGTGTGGTLLATITGTSFAQTNIVSTGRTMTIQFVSDGSGTGSYEFHYSTGDLLVTTCWGWTVLLDSATIQPNSAISVSDNGPIAGGNVPMCNLYFDANKNPYTPEIAFCSNYHLTSSGVNSGYTYGQMMFYKDTLSPADFSPLVIARINWLLKNAASLGYDYVNNPTKAGDVQHAIWGLLGQNSGNSITATVINAVPTLPDIPMLSVVSSTNPAPVGGTITYSLTTDVTSPLLLYVSDNGTLPTLCGTNPSGTTLTGNTLTVGGSGTRTVTFCLTRNIATDISLVVEDTSALNTADMELFIPCSPIIQRFLSAGTAIYANTLTASRWVACTQPSALVLSQTAPTCSGSTALNNGKISITSISNADKYGISTGSTYAGPLYASATSFTAPYDLQTGIPNSGQTYTIRFFNGEDGCFKDTTVTVSAVTCSSLGILPHPAGPSASTCLRTDYILGTPCYTHGTATSGGASAAGTAFVSFPYNSVGQSGSTNYTGAPMSGVTHGDIGACWGVAFQESTQSYFTSAVLKRHVGYGPLGTGGIYKIAVGASSLSSTQFLDLASLGVNTGADTRTAWNGAPITANELPNDPNTDASWDVDAFPLVGKRSIGDLDISQDGNTLYCVNLNNRTLVAVNISGASPTLIGEYNIPIPADCPNGDFRPWALKVYNGYVYVGAVCSAESTQNRNDLKAYVLGYNISAGTWGLLYQNNNLSFARRQAWSSSTGASTWNPWTNTYISLSGSSSTAIYPQPILSDIEIDSDGSLILAFIDRNGHQIGYFNYPPNTSSTTFIQGITAGDILRVASVAGTYTLENNGQAGSVTTIGNNDADGPGGGEFYWGEQYAYDQNTNPDTPIPAHAETIFGGIAFVPGLGEIAATAMNPTLGTNSGGTIWLSNSTGGRTSYLASPAGTSSFGYQLYSDTYLNLGKANGLGDIEAGCTAVTCVQPSLVSTSQTAPNCTRTTANNNGTISLTAVTNADKYAISAGSTYSSAIDYSTATAIGALPMIVQSGIPNTGGTYTLRLYNMSNDCFTDVTIVVAAVSCPVSPCVSGNTGGTVWVDTNNNGIFDAAEVDGLAGITVKAFDCNGNLVATATTDALGFYTFGNLTYPNTYRIEFSGLPSDYVPSSQGTDGLTDVQFVSAASCTVDFGVKPVCTTVSTAQILQPGYSILTCLPGADSVVLAVKDIRALGTLWDTPSNRNVNQSDQVPVGVTWTKDQFGSNKVFGLTVDQRDGTIYVATSEMVGDAQHTGGYILGSYVQPQIYKIGPVSTTPVLLATLPGNLGVGGIEIDTLHNQLFAVGMDDGKIYRLDATSGALLQTYDPLLPDNNSVQAPPPLGDALWGLGYNHVEQKLYYGVWANHALFSSGYGPASADHNIIRSVDIASGGSINAATDALKMSLPFLPAGYSQPVSDIEFNAAGTRVLLAESGITQFDPSTYSTAAHDARVFEYAKTGATWVLEPLYGSNLSSKYDIGNLSFYKGQNSRGGVAWGYHDAINNVIGGDEQFMLSTADAMHLTSAGDPDWVYGYQMTPSTGGNLYNSMIVNLGSTSASGTKYTFNDVEIYKGNACASGLEIGNYVWLDANQDGVQDPCELPISNVTVNLKQGTTLVATTTTNSTGNYYFGGTNNSGFTFENQPAVPQVYSETITNTTNDARQNSTDVATGAGGLIFNDRYLGLRFPAVDIPVGAVITGATIRFTANAAGDINNVTIKAEKNPDATPWVTGPGTDISNRYNTNPTSAAVTWTNANTWVAAASGPDQTTPDLSAMVAEIVALPTWARGKSMNFIFNAPANATGATAFDVSGSATSGAVLTISYTGTTQTTGGTLDPNSSYTICIPLDQVPLTSAHLVPTVINSTITNANDINDSDGAKVGTDVVLDVTTPDQGADHTFDFGFFPGCDTTLVLRDTAVCEGNPVNLFALATGITGTATWRTASTSWTSLVDPTVVNPTATTTYFIKDSLYVGCLDIDTLVITALPPATGTVTYTGCVGDGYSVTVNSVLYNESNPTGTETLTAYNGCDSVVTITLTFNALPNAGSDVELMCSGGNAPTAYALGISGAWSVVSQPAGANAQIDGSGNVTAMTLAGLYTFELTVNGCTDQVVITVPVCTPVCPPVICLPVRVVRL